MKQNYRDIQVVHFEQRKIIEEEIKTQTARKKKSAFEREQVLRFLLKNMITAYLIIITAIISLKIKYL